MNKTLQTFYYILCAIFLGLAYSYLIDRFHLAGRLLASLTGLLIILVFAVTLISLILFYYLRTAKRPIYGKLIRLSSLPVLGLIPFFIICAIPRQLDDETHKIKVAYIAYGCECANWKIIEDNGTKCNDNDCDEIFLEPINDKVFIPDTIGYNGDIIELTGKFYSQKGFPKDYYSEQQPEKARVFQFTDYKVINSNHFDSQKSIDE
ncbi:hypothetical protein IUY40_14005 [Flavobacterium sp. ALJ2]|uniref:hypothetical protein n=1 Tax=Flavobacterium sp. ALJ2 TaxID=2786960 RepID=UPI00189DA778|nr:hypothetical protein [Flavobacterium sp. ALJ2]MBF7092646.1 hypothetical protein [Flavobacterium sp. ALJ2]